jgi:hypothetical protein
VVLPHKKGREFWGSISKKNKKELPRAQKKTLRTITLSLINHQNQTNKISYHLPY